MDIRTIDLNLLPVLDALLRQQSVTLAARELDMSQSALSAALARLRKLLGDELFVRTGRGLLPTPRASALAEPVVTILEQVRERVLHGGAFDPATARRAFRILLSDVGAYVLLPRLVRAVRAQAPGVSLTLRPLTGTDIAADLADGRIDLAVGSYPGLPESLFQRRLFERHFVGLVRRDHPLAGRRPTLRGFAAAPQLVVRMTSGIQEHIDAVLAARRLARRDVLELPSYLMVPPLLLATDFLAVLPGQLADAFMHEAALSPVDLPLALPRSTIRMHWHRRYHDDAGNTWLRDLVAAELTDG
ncbi:LysR family transcriptional regulator [Ottowia sp.]|uniref:LysR family transcriptional regulator n=1 Tax=Ottowia sp. TaxID=1898956 RepID=UPI002C6494C6|nr:LysR family transcriptional regulator [Ottowia sp.]HOB65575.1 LysR family transcriptional regulator [Ottowia sp.]HPZ56616.1 LysR family transcriptional regulator [Ottowia sp.]HQD46677.1 LysR family transcriptional regulator [Ottowia sp.]